MLEVRDLRVRFGAATVVDGVSFTVSPGQWLMLAGPNGAGKSTVVNAIAQSVPYTGRVLLDGADVRKSKPRALARQIGVLSQSTYLSYPFTVEEIVRLGRYAYAPDALAAFDEAGEAAVEDALKKTGLTAQRKRSALTLSGGELQRAFLAQVFAQDPAYLLLDEPTNHLDLAYQKEVFSLLGTWLKQPGRAIVSVVHDLSLARACGTDALLLDHGCAATQGPIAETLSEPHLNAVYGMDVGGWMRDLLSQWGGTDARAAR